jgi:hypothetical protein
MKKIIRLTEQDLYRIVKRVLKEEEEDYIPTGVPDSDGYVLILDKNSSIGILDDGEYILRNSDPVFKKYNTTKKIPNGVEYYIRVIKNVDGFDVVIDHDGYIKIKDQKLVDNSWNDLFSKFNKVSFNTPNDLLSDEDDIFQSLLDNTVPCYEIDKTKQHTINYDIETGVVNSFGLYLNSKCEGKKNVYLVLNSSHGCAAVDDNNDCDIVWDGNDLSFPKSKSGESKLIIKV